MHPFNSHSQAYLFVVRVDKMMNTFKAIRAGMILLLSILLISGVTKTMSILIFTKSLDTVADVTVGFVRIAPNNTPTWTKHGLLGATASIPTVNNEAIFTNAQLLEWYDKEVTFKNTGTLPIDIYITVENTMTPALLGVISDSVTVTATDKTVTSLDVNRWYITNVQPEESIKVTLKINIVLSLSIVMGNNYEFTSFIQATSKQNNEVSLLEVDSPTMCYLSDTKTITNIIKFGK